jgi:hypothetical protein
MDAGAAQAAQDSGPTVLTFASGPDWPWLSGDASGTDGGVLGHAVDVCIGATVPPNCPADAVLYQTDPEAAWQADTSAFPDAHWIWRGDVTPDGLADGQVAVFQKTFAVGSHATGAISIAADDMATVQVNGIVVGTVGSTTDVAAASMAQSTLTSIDLGPYLVLGDNAITIIGVNGPFGMCDGPCGYASNPAGVVFAGTIRSAP